MEAHWAGYLNALGGQRAPKGTIDAGIEPATGFQTLIPKNPAAQKKYDAMSPEWQGIKASESAAASNLYKASFMPVHHK